MSELKKCPVCDGRGFVKGNFYDMAGNTCSFGDYAKKEQSTAICMYCNGNGVVNVGYEDASSELLSLLLVVAFSDKKKSINVMNEYLRIHENYMPKNIKETMQGLIDDFKKDLGKDDE